MKKVLVYIFIVCVPLLLQSQTNHSHLEHFIANNVEKAFINENDASYFISSWHKSSVSGATHYYLGQSVSGIAIHNSVMSVHFDKNWNVAEFHNKFIKEPYKKINSLNPGITSRQALRSVAEELKIDERLIPEKDVEGSGRSAITDYGITKMSRSPLKLKLVYYNAKDSSLKLSWEVSILQNQNDDLWNLFIDAMNGEVLDKFNQTIYCNFNEGEHKVHHHTEACNIGRPAGISKDTRIMGLISMNNTYNVYPVGVESPNHGSRTLVASPHDVLGSPYGWHDVNGIAGAEYTNTKGNNVDAFENDLNLPNTSPSGGSGLNFNFSYDDNADPGMNINPIVTNVFYWNNVLHDILYRYGFTEDAGNFQQNNYGRGGMDNDFVIANPLDPTVNGNASFSTPNDGSNPRIRLGTWYEPIKLSVPTPSLIAGRYTIMAADFGEQLFDITAQISLASPILSCSAVNDLSNKIALIDRGSSACDFSTKVLNAQNAGALAAVVCNTSNTVFKMSGGSNAYLVTIPAVMMGKDDCDVLKANINNLTGTISSSPPTPKSSGMDNAIIAHEYAHGLTNRLTGGPNITTCLNNEEQMGEGWSDYFGLMLTAKSTDNGPKKRGIATYLKQQPLFGTGIRPYPYSTDTIINPVKYDSIKIDKFPAPHGVGSVWCSMLWDMTWLFQNIYGFSSDLYQGNAGNNKAMTLVVEALKLQPCQPGFVDGRNAILKADSIINGGIHSCLIWKAFAQRGLGANASQGSSGSKTDGTQSFALPNSCRNVVTITDNAGLGSLRQTIANSVSNDTIKFAPYLSGMPLQITDSPITVDKNLKIINNFPQELNFAFSGNSSFFINSGVNLLIDRINFTHTGNIQQIINNSGILTIKDSNIGNQKSIQNSGSIIINGSTRLKTN